MWLVLENLWLRGANGDEHIRATTEDLTITAVNLDLDRYLVSRSNAFGDDRIDLKKGH